MQVMRCEQPENSIYALLSGIVAEKTRKINPIGYILYRVETVQRTLLAQHARMAYNTVVSSQLERLQHRRGANELKNLIHSARVKFQ